MMNKTISATTGPPPFSYRLNRSGSSLRSRRVKGRVRKQEISILERKNAEPAVMRQPPAGLWHMSCARRYFCAKDPASEQRGAPFRLVLPAPEQLADRPRPVLPRRVGPQSLLPLHREHVHGVVVQHSACRLERQIAARTPVGQIGCQKQQRPRLVGRLDDGRLTQRLPECVGSFEAGAVARERTGYVDHPAVALRVGDEEVHLHPVTEAEVLLEHCETARRQEVL